MTILEMQDGFVTLRCHWTELRPIADALQRFDNPPPAEMVAVDALAAAFTALTIAANLQVQTGNNDVLTFDTLKGTVTA